MEYPRAELFPPLPSPSPLLSPQTDASSRDARCSCPPSATRPRREPPQDRMVGGEGKGVWGVHDRSASTAAGPLTPSWGLVLPPHLLSPTFLSNSARRASAAAFLSAAAAWFFSFLSSGGPAAASATSASRPTATRIFFDAIGEGVTARRGEKRRFVLAKDKPPTPHTLRGTIVRGKKERSPPGGTVTVGGTVVNDCRR